jgi:hypothetical protein
MRLLPILAVLGGEAMFGAAALSHAKGCSDMLQHAPASVRRLEAVRSCAGAQAACAYMEPSVGHGVLTLICPVSGVRQVFGAQHLSSLRMRNGALTGSCRIGSWRRDAGLPGCYVRDRD